MKVIYRELLSNEEEPKLILETNTEIPKPGENDVLIQVKACGLAVLPHKVLATLRLSQQLRIAAGQEVAGVVTQTGSAVTSVRAGDHVAGLVPLDSDMSGCADFCMLKEYDLVVLPNTVSFESAAGCVGDCLRAYIALHYQARLCSGDTILVIDGATSFGTMAIQLAQLWGAKVMATVQTAEERSYLETLQPQLAEIIDSGDKTRPIQNSVMDDTGGVGVDCVIDNGARLFTSEEDKSLIGEGSTFPSCHKHDIIACLGVGGRWVTSQPDLQLDPPDSQLLFLKNASVCFLFEQSWLLSNSQQGRYKHILTDIIEHISHKRLRPNITRQVSFENTIATLKMLKSLDIGKTVMTV